MQKHDFGKIGITLGGDYSPTRQYEALTYVRYDNKFWLSIKATLDNAPSNDSEYWMMLAEDDVIGDQGFPNVVSFTIYLNEWENEVIPYQYNLGTDLEIAFGSDYKNMDFRLYLNDNATEDQKNQAILANIIGASDDCIFAYGDKPTVDIPALLVYYDP